MDSGSGEVPLVVFRASLVSQSVGKDRQETPPEVRDRSGRHVILSVPANASAHNSFTQISADVGKMVIPGDRAYLDNKSLDDVLETVISHSFMGTQGVVYLKDKVRELAWKLEQADAKHVNCEKETVALKQCNVELEGVVHDLKAQLASRDRDVRELQVTLDQMATLSIRVKELEDEVIMWKDAVEETGLTTEVLIRGEMCQDLHDGKEGQ